MTQRVQFFLDETDESNHNAHPLFSELEELILNKDGEPEWKETARSVHGVDILRWARW